MSTYQEATKQLHERIEQFKHTNDKLADACRRLINADNDTERLAANEEIQQAQNEMSFTQYGARVQS